MIRKEPSKEMVKFLDEEMEKQIKKMREREKDPSNWNRNEFAAPVSSIEKEGDKNE